MASSVLLESGLRPLPLRHSVKANGVYAPNSRISFCKSNSNSRGLNLIPSLVRRNGNAARGRDWGLNVSAPLRVAPFDERQEESGDGEKKGAFVNGAEYDEFDPSAPPPFSLGEIRAAIPKHLWAKNPWRSMSYVVRDVAVVFVLAAAAAHVNNWFVWPLYWAAQGTMFWALFVLGHDWRISHRTHHQNHGHVENDESWHPLSESLFKSLDHSTRTLRFKVPFPMFAYPFYLWSRSPGKTGSHFDPDSDLFHPNERKDVITSTVCWSAMAALLAGLSFVIGPVQMLKLYFVPYLIFVMWLDLVTYLHHHGHEDKLPWYRGKMSSKDLVLTVDFLFFTLPTVIQTKAAKHVLGKYYREPKKSAPMPFHLIGTLLRSMSRDHYVSDTGDVVYYQTDPELNRSMTKKSE
ncbi:hypothetical protein ACLOJK_025633 [Asimina triloba]